MITEDFVEQVIYHKSQSLTLKGSPYVTAVMQELLAFRLYLIGENILFAMEDYALMSVKLDRVREASRKLAIYAEMDGGWDQPISEEALEMMDLALNGDD